MALYNSISFSGASSGQNISCFPQVECSPDDASIMSTPEDCCRHGVPPFGVSYLLPGDENCIPCPVGKLIFGPKNNATAMNF